jgi:hypothetical protein
MRTPSHAVAAAPHGALQDAGRDTRVGLALAAAILAARAVLLWARPAHWRWDALGAATPLAALAVIAHLS